MEVSGQLHAPAALYSGKESSTVPIDKRLSGPQNRSGPGGDEIISAAAVNRTPVVQPVAWKLYWLSYLGSEPVISKSKIWI
jgi:hypothetical protein